MRIAYGNRNLAPRKWRRLARKAAGGSTVTPIHKSLTKTVVRGYTQNKKVLAGAPQPAAIPLTWLNT